MWTAEPRFAAGSDLPDTIAAIATAKGAAGIGIIRLSGSKAYSIAQQLTAQTFTPRYAKHTSFLNCSQQPIDLGLVLFFPGPHSFTGEDVIELHGHGGVVVLDLLLARVIELGARLAQPGEFSLRAFLNNKIDLVQAEAIAALIAADSMAAAAAAVRSLQGAFSEKITTLVTNLIDLRVALEAAIDFPEEETEVLTDHNTINKLTALTAEVADLVQHSKYGALLADGIKTVIVGRTNAGKSSLLNLLAGEDTAIVTDIPGTTRDLLKANILLAGMKLQLIDTAGLRDTTDPIEQQGIARALNAAAQADLLLVVVDATTVELLGSPDVFKLFPELHKIVADTAKIVLLYNKIDLLPSAQQQGFLKDSNIVAVSSKTGQGIPELLQKLEQILGISGNVLEHVFIARRRHVNALQQGLVYLQTAQHALQNKAGSELVAEDLRLAQQCFAQITGEFSSDDLLGKIFSEFCIGK